MNDDTLPLETIERLTGYSRKRPALQLAELKRQGFYRARIVRGEVILERPHYDAVASGQVDPVKPKVRTPQLRLAT